MSTEELPRSGLCFITGSPCFTDGETVASHGLCGQRPEGLGQRALLEPRLWPPAWKCLMLGLKEPSSTGQMEKLSPWGRYQPGQDRCLSSCSPAEGRLSHKA